MTATNFFDIKQCIPRPESSSLSSTSTPSSTTTSSTTAPSKSSHGEHTEIFDPAGNLQKESGLVSDPTILQPSLWRKPCVLATEHLRHEQVHLTRIARAEREIEELTARTPPA
jgi:hypothetical protein